MFDRIQFRNGSGFDSQSDFLVTALAKQLLENPEIALASDHVFSVFRLIVACAAVQHKEEIVEGSW